MRGKRKGKSKKGAQVAHARRRAWLRFGVRLTDDDSHKLAKKIQAGKLELLEKQSNRISLYKMVLGEEDAVVVYDRQRKAAVTFLTMRMYEQKKRGEPFMFWENA